MDRRLHEIEEGLERELGALLGSVNFSGYSERAQLRSDDLAVRNVASRYVLEAKHRVAAAISSWWSDEGGEPTRDKPFPDAAVSQRLRKLRAFEATLAQLESSIRGAAAPDVDAVWNRRSDGSAILQSLIATDTALVRSARRLAEAADEIRAEELTKPEPFAPLAQQLADVEDTFRARREMLENLALNP